MLFALDSLGDLPRHEGLSFGIDFKRIPLGWHNDDGSISHVLLEGRPAVGATND